MNAYKNVDAFRADRTEKVGAFRAKILKTWGFRAAPYCRKMGVFHGGLI